MQINEAYLKKAMAYANSRSDAGIRCSKSQPQHQTAYCTNHRNKIRYSIEIYSPNEYISIAVHDRERFAAVSTGVIEPEFENGRMLINVDVAFTQHSLKGAFNQSVLQYVRNLSWCYEEYARQSSATGIEILTGVREIVEYYLRCRYSKTFEIKHSIYTATLAKGFGQ